MRTKSFWIKAGLAVLIVALGAGWKLHVFGGGIVSDSDGHWYNCLDQNCRRYLPLSPWSPSLSADEKKLMEMIDSIPSPPGKTSKAALTTLFGRAPDSIVGDTPTFSRLQWTNYGPGDDPQRGIVVYIHSSQARNIKWYAPGRYLMTKDFLTEEDRQYDAMMQARIKAEKMQGK